MQARVPMRTFAVRCLCRARQQRIASHTVVHRIHVLGVACAVGKYKGINYDDLRNARLVAGEDMIHTSKQLELPNIQ